MCYTWHTIKFLCDFEDRARPGKTHVYSKTHNLAQQWQGCDKNKDRNLRHISFFETETRRPCENSVRVLASKICPDCSAKYGRSITERITSHTRTIIYLLEKAGGIDTEITGPELMKGDVFHAVVKYHSYLSDVAHTHTYDRRHPDHPPDPENDNESERIYLHALIDLENQILNERYIQERKPDGGDRGIIRELFYQQVRARIERHRISVPWSIKTQDKAKSWPPQSESWPPQSEGWPPQSNRRPPQSK
ncbi:hypothetical protein EAE99_006063 [Botrytis elliptica]|nr:hypothetical protein EAE99_006063 [Botrytis elliptica]